MGTWSTSLSSDDIYADIYFEFFDLYNDGYSVKDISAKLITENQEIREDPDTDHNFWFALAKAQWECKELDPSVLARVTAIIEDGQDIAVWRELGASEADIRKRQAVLDGFLQKLRTERPKPKARRKKSTVVRQPVYHKGDCLTFKFSKGTYGGAVVLEAMPGTSHEGSYNLIAYTDINSEHKPTLQDFKKSSVPYQKQEAMDSEFEVTWRDYPALYWALCVYPKDAEDCIELVGNIQVKKKYDIRNYTLGIPSGGPFNKYNVQSIENLLLAEQSDNKHKHAKLRKFTGTWF